MSFTHLLSQCDLRADNVIVRKVIGQATYLVCRGTGTGTGNSWLNSNYAAKTRVVAGFTHRSTLPFQKDYLLETGQSGTRPVGFIFCGLCVTPRTCHILGRSLT